MRGLHFRRALREVSPPLHRQRPRRRPGRWSGPVPVHAEGKLPQAHQLRSHRRKLGTVVWNFVNRECEFKIRGLGCILSSKGGYNICSKCSELPNSYPDVWGFTKCRNGECSWVIKCSKFTWQSFCHFLLPTNWLHSSDYGLGDFRVGCGVSTLILGSQNRAEPRFGVATPRSGFRSGFRLGFRSVLRPQRSGDYPEANPESPQTHNQMNAA